MEASPTKSAQSGANGGGTVWAPFGPNNPIGTTHMKTNVGLSDRALRLFVGLTLLGLGTALDTPWGLLGLIPMLTAGLGFCPLYPLLGINTCEDSH